AALFTQQRFRRRLIHGRAGAIDAHQSAVFIENEDAVRHHIECRFPFLLGARNHFEKLSLRDTSCELRRDGFDQKHLVLTPPTSTLSLMNRNNAAKFAVYD